MRVPTNFRTLIHFGKNYKFQMNLTKKKMRSIIPAKCTYIHVYLFTTSLIIKICTAVLEDKNSIQLKARILSSNKPKFSKHIVSLITVV